VCVWDEDGGAVVSIAQPGAMFEIVKNSSLQPLVQEVDQRLRSALDQIKSER
jgi:4-aminobutyrate aminotransferase-like enzyme